MSISLTSLPPRPTSTASPPTAAEHFAALSALHTHYRVLVAAERDTMVRERQLWEDERKLYIRRIEELEAAATAPPPQPTQPVEWSPPAHQPATREWAPPPYLAAAAATTIVGSQQQLQQQEHPRLAPPAIQAPPPQPAPTNNIANSKPVLALDDDDDDDEISPEEMAQLLREATRIVYPISHARPRGRSLAEPARGKPLVPHHDSELEEGSGEEEVELKLKKTSNFGMDFGKWR